MRLDVGNLVTRATDTTPEEEAWLAGFLTYEDERAGSTRLFSWTATEFPAGLTDLVARAAADEGLRCEVMDRRPRVGGPVEALLTAAPWGWLYDFQREACTAALRAGRGVIESPTGCHPHGTQVLMADGSLRQVQDVVVGDRVAGPAGPRTVMWLCRGEQEMVTVVPVKGESWGANVDHVLTLVNTTTGALVDVTVRAWRSWSLWTKHTHKLLRASVDNFEGAHELPMDPYILGLLLGDGCLTRHVAVVAVEPEIQAAVREFAAYQGCLVREELTGYGAPQFRLATPRGQRNPVLAILRALGVHGCNAASKYIPQEYLVGPREARLQLLAGLVDSDGALARAGYDYISKSENLARGVARLARSVGLAAYVTLCEKRSQNGTGGTYWRVSVSGDCSVVPCRVPRKRAPVRRQIKNVLRTGFHVKPAGVGAYYGFRLDGDGRYLLADFTVTHNSGKGEMACALAMAVPVPWLFVVHRAHLVRDVAARWERRYGVAPVVLMDGMPKEPPRFALATFQWLHRHLRAPQVRAVLGAVQGLVVDEAHVQPASTFMEVSAAIPNAYYRLGLSGTPFDRADGRSIVGVSMLGPRVYRIEARTLIDLGLLAEPVITMVEHHHPPAPGADWRALEDRLIVDSAERNALVVRLVEAADKPCVCFFHRERHGRNLLRALRASRLRVVLVNGKSSPQAREKAQQAVRDGDVDVLLASGVFQEGVDLPELRDVVNAGGWAAAIPALQKLGRGTRSRNKAGETVKTSFRLLDVYDRGNRILESHAAARAHAYRGRGHRVTVGPVS